MADVFRRSKRHRHGIVLIGKYDKNELTEFSKKHPKRNVLYIGQYAVVPNNSQLPQRPSGEKEWDIQIHYKNNWAQKEDIDKIFKNIPEGVDVGVTRDAMKTEEPEGDNLKTASQTTSQNALRKSMPATLQKTASQHAPRKSLPPIPQKNASQHAPRKSLPPTPQKNASQTTQPGAEVPGRLSKDRIAGFDAMFDKVKKPK